MKNTTQWTILIILIAVAGIYAYTVHDKVTSVMEQQRNEIEQQQAKNRALQEENMLLHDDVATLNFQLMKENVSDQRN